MERTHTSSTWTWQTGFLPHTALTAERTARSRLSASASGSRRRALGRLSRVATTVSSYLRQTVETQAGEENEGVRLALYFERKAPTITGAYSILADSALLKVVQTALGLAAETGNADIDVQANYIASRLDIESLSDPDQLKKFLSRFTAMWEATNPTSTATSSVVNLITGQSSSVMSADMLMSLQGLKLGGH